MTAACWSRRPRSASGLLLLLLPLVALAVAAAGRLGFVVLGSALRMVLVVAVIGCGRGGRL